MRKRALVVSGYFISEEKHNDANITKIIYLTLEMDTKWFDILFVPLFV